jgi:hypothetical protein
MTHAVLLDGEPVGETPEQRLARRCEALGQSRTWRRRRSPSDTPL